MNMFSPLLGLVNIVSGNRLRTLFSSLGHMKYIEFIVQDPYFLLYLTTLYAD